MLNKLHLVDWQENYISVSHLVTRHISTACGLLSQPSWVMKVDSTSPTLLSSKLSWRSAGESSSDWFLGRIKLLSPLKLTFMLFSSISHFFSRVMVFFLNVIIHNASGSTQRHNVYNVILSIDIPAIRKCSFSTTLVVEGLDERLLVLFKVGILLTGDKVGDDLVILTVWHLGEWMVWH